jgi:hypothetical protein
MTITPHILTGAALASLLPASPHSMRMLGFLVGFGSHYILDAAPHWERIYGARYNDELPADYGRWPKHVTTQSLVDVLIGSILFLTILFVVVPDPIKVCVCLGGIGAILPDLMDNVPWWSKRTKRLLVWRYLAKLHHWLHMNYDLQRKLPSLLGLFTQLAVIIIALLILMRHYA